MEINSSLSCFKVSSAPVPSKFLGQDLVPLLELALKVEEGMELLKEFDRLITACTALCPRCVAKPLAWNVGQ